MLVGLEKISGSDSEFRAQKAALGKNSRGNEMPPITPTYRIDFPLRFARFRLTDTAMRLRGHRRNNHLQ